MVKTHQYYIEYSPETKEDIAKTLVTKYASNCKIALAASDFYILMDDGLGALRIIEMEGYSIESIVGYFPRQIPFDSTVVLIINAKDNLSIPIPDMASLSKFSEMLPSHTDLIWGVGLNKDITSEFQIVIITKAIE